MGAHVVTYPQEGNAVRKRDHREMEERAARQLDRFLWPLRWGESAGTGKLI